MELSNTLNIAKSVECIELFECFEPIIELKNLDQTSAWVCLAKARNTYSYVITTWTNPCNNFNKSMLQGCRRGSCQFFYMRKIPKSMLQLLLAVNSFDS